MLPWPAFIFKGEESPDSACRSPVTVSKRQSEAASEVEIGPSTLNTTREIFTSATRKRQAHLFVRGTATGIKNLSNLKTSFELKPRIIGDNAITTAFSSIRTS